MFSYCSKALLQKSTNMRPQESYTKIMPNCEIYCSRFQPIISKLFFLTIGYCSSFPSALMFFLSSLSTPTLNKGFQWLIMFYITGSLNLRAMIFVIFKLFLFWRGELELLFQIHFDENLIYKKRCKFSYSV